MDSFKTSIQLSGDLAEVVVVHTFDESPEVTQFSSLDEDDSSHDVSGFETSETPTELIPSTWYTWALNSLKQIVSEVFGIKSKFDFPEDDSAFDCSLKSLRNGPAPPLNLIKTTFFTIKKPVKYWSNACRALSVLHRLFIYPAHQTHLVAT